MVIKGVVWASVLVLVSYFGWAGAPDTEITKIKSLLQTVERSGVTFVRNDQAHSGTEATEHLRMKWNGAQDQIKTVEQFIDHVASESSTTGQPYAVRLRDGSTLPARAWLYGALAALTTSDTSATPKDERRMAPVGLLTPYDILSVIYRSELTFLREDDGKTEHRTGPNMAYHIARKYAFLSSEEMRAVEFIQTFCTKSAIHGTYYEVQLPDGQRMHLDEWLHKELKMKPLDTPQS
ncbi:MAG: DUF5329 family protein [Candidatus Hydrogenedentes bacterium]|nr:DUF5329 family protein [Candidatus Hydrogenedentota bacterium]